MKRVKWKGVYVEPKNYKETSDNCMISRKTSVIPKFIGKTVKIHNGKKFKEILITKEMLNHKLGEFFKTRADFEFKKKKKKKK
jgi:small subunit ribosomal protein S19